MRTVSSLLRGTSSSVNLTPEPKFHLSELDPGASPHHLLDVVEIKGLAKQAGLQQQVPPANRDDSRGTGDRVSGYILFGHVQFADPHERGPEPIGAGAEVGGRGSTKQISSSSTN